jgi:chorismate synthase
MIRILTAGESHGEALVGIVEGLPAGVPVTRDAIDRQLARRWLGFGRGGRAKFEKDQIHIYSGVRFARTMGSPVALRLSNAAYERDRSGWPEVMAIEGSGDDVDTVTLPRPGHADLAGLQKYGFDDIRPVIERASARETAMRVACCTLARLLLREVGIQIGSHVTRIGLVGRDDGAPDRRRDDLIGIGAEALSRTADESDVRMIDGDLADAAVEHIREIKDRGDSVGGAYEVVATGVPAGLGSYVHWDRRLDGQLAQAIVSIQGQKAVEIGDGFASSRVPGSEFHDPIATAAEGYRRESNHAGGVEGGVSNGMSIIVRGFMKPIPTLIKPLQTVDVKTGAAQPTRYERSDVTSVPAASTVAEAMVALVLANAVLDRFGGDTMSSIRTAMGREAAASRSS